VIRWEPGIFHGWLVVLRHPMRLRRWWWPMAMSGFCWLIGHEEERPVVNITLRTLTVKCKVCKMQLMGRKLQDGELPLAGPGAHAEIAIDGGGASDVDDLSSDPAEAG